MPYKLLLSEEITPAVRRMMLEQLKRARRSLSSEQNVQEGIHNTRKSFKKLRSLVRLARPILGKKLFRSENRLYRDLARELAAPRTYGALLETLAKFNQRADMQSLAPLLSDLEHMILAEKKRQENDLEIVALIGLIAQIDDAIDRWSSLSLPSAKFDTLAHGFAATYGMGRDSLGIVLDKNTSVHLHEWRKHMQQTWRHMQILTLIWPEDIMPRIKLAREISQLLGTEHDIAELLTFIKSHKKELLRQKNRKPMIKAFRARAKAAQRDLCMHALERGRRLYAFKQQAIEDAMVTYWHSAKALQPMPSLALELANLVPKEATGQQNQRKRKDHGRPVLREVSAIKIIDKPNED